ncbi:MAG: hypothetical protein HOV79_23810 [Hamadaea sp.]|nr:hypothetical protein [Hamadaea sp.]
MINELGRILTLAVTLIAGVLRRAFRGLRFLVRRAAQIRTASASANPGSGRLLDVAALSVVADLLMLAEWWRRSAPPAGFAGLLGLVIGLVVVGLAVGLLRAFSGARFVLAGIEAARLGCAALLAFAPATFASTSSANLAVGGVIAFGLAERAFWALSAAPGRRRPVAAAAARYVIALLIPAALAVLAGLALGGLWALLLAQVALFAAMIVALALPSGGTPKAADAVSPVKKQRPRRAKPAPKAEVPPEPLPAPREEPDAGEGGYHLYRPSSMNGPGDPPPPPPVV